MLEKWICLLEESGVPWDIKVEGQNSFAPRICIEIIADGKSQYKLIFEYDSAEEKTVLIGCGMSDD